MAMRSGGRGGRGGGRNRAALPVMRNDDGTMLEADLGEPPLFPVWPEGFMVLGCMLFGPAAVLPRAALSAPGLSAGFWVLCIEFRV